MAGHETWTFAGGAATARGDVAPAVRSALDSHGSLYRWAALRPGREVFAGRGEAYGTVLGDVRAVVRHARRGGLVGPLLGDLYAGRPRFEHEIAVSLRLAEAGVPTPAVLAGVAYKVGPLHRADVATERVDGSDLAELFFGERPPEGAAREAALRAVGSLVRRLHGAGYVHPDLQLRNVVVRAVPPPLPSHAVLLDVDTCREVAGRAARRANLARFFRSWEKWNRLRGTRLGPADRAAFEAGYEEADR